MRLDLKNGFDAAQSLRPQARTASANGTGVDLAGFDGAVVVIDVGLWTDGSHTFEVQDSPDNSTFTAVADSFLQGAEPVVDGATDDDQIYRIGYLGVGKFLRVITTVSGTTTGAVYAAAIVRGKGRKQPV